MSVSRSKRTAQNVLTGFFYQIVTMLINFVSRTVFIRTLGTEYLGLNGIFGDVLTLLSMADLGFSTAMSYSFYKPLAENDTNKITALVAFYKKVYNTIAVVVLGLGLCCIPFLRVIVNTERDIPLLEVYYLFSLAGVVTSYLFVYKTTLLTADQKDFKVVQIRMITQVSKTVLQIIALYIWKNYIIFLAISLISGLLNNFIASLKAEKEYPYIKDVKQVSAVGKEVRAGIIDNMKSVFIYKFSTTIFSATDNIIISMVISTAVVGLYSNYLMVSNKLLLAEQIIFSAMTASVGNVIAKEKPEKRFGVFQSMQSMSYIFCGIISVIYGLMINDVIKIWLGEEFLLPPLLVIAVTVNAYFSCALQPLWIYRDATGLYRKTKYIMLIAAIENIVLSVVLGKLIGVAGVIFASAISRLTTYCWYEPKLLFREYFERGPVKYYVGILSNVILTIAVIFGGSLLTSMFTINNWLMLIVKGIIVAVTCSLIFILIYIRTEGAQNIIKKVRSIIQGKIL